MFFLFGGKPKKKTYEDNKPAERKRNYVTMFTFSRDKVYFPIINAAGTDGRTISLYVTFSFRILDMEEFRNSDPTAADMMEEMGETLKQYRRQYRSMDLYAGGGAIILKLCTDLLAKYYPCVSVSDGLCEVVTLDND
ncbi:MAG: hypothetical protein J5757_03405 [Lachnospiraceae bacterium]|nr:hypothetical protein [Lachnospiraceae bacterium]